MNSVIIGRFQPFTLGHLAMYQFAEKMFSKVYIGLSRSKAQNNIDNPFSWEDRKKWIEPVLGNVILEAKGFHFDILEEQLKEKFVVVVGQDQSIALSDMIQYDTPPYYVVPRTTKEISATKVRNALLSGDEGLFRTMVPEQLHGEYSYMRKIITAYENSG